MDDLIANLRAAIDLPRSEIVSRANAWDEVRSKIVALIPTLQECSERTTSASIASLAGKVLGGYVPTPDEVERMAASCLAQAAPNDQPHFIPTDSALVALRSLKDAQATGQAHVSLQPFYRATAANLEAIEARSAELAARPVVPRILPGREPGDWGTHEDAVNFILRSDYMSAFGPGEAEEFLRSWSEGRLGEWPEYVEYLNNKGTRNAE